MAEQDRTPNRLRAFRASNPAAVLPPAIVDDLGGVESHRASPVWLEYFTPIPCCRRWAGDLWESPAQRRIAA